MTIFDSIRAAYKNKLPFVAYRKPYEELVSGVFQQDQICYFTKDYSEKGFVFAPFDNRENAVLFPLEFSKKIKEPVKINTAFKAQTVFSEDSSSKVSHEKLVAHGVTAIQEGLFKKVVLSRKETLEITSFDLLETFQKLLVNYPNAMCYVWFHPKVGLWLGASPETLLKVTEKSFETMALAGTQLYKGTTDVTWQEKELKEQQFVTDYILKNVSKVAVDIQKTAVETVKAGSLLHLKTKITGTLNFKGSNLQQLLKELHPTPAVCGLPKAFAKEFILENENYDRTFYTGFFGELNFSNSTSDVLYSDLFVNLRCMNVENNQVNLYVGGGITKESCPEKEWEETVAKSAVMKKVL